MTEPDLELEVAWQQHVSPDRHPLDGLLARHREKHRRYHTATHVAWVIRHVDDLAGSEAVDDLDAIVAAAFYHDAIYEPTYPANERASARLARRDLAALGWSDARCDRVATMIEATRHDAETSTDPSGDTAVLLDADLAVLGADPAGYAAYVTGVRAEYRHLDDDEWRSGRTSVLQGFLQRPTLFATEAGRARWEQRARANIAAELARLS